MTSDQISEEACNLACELGAIMEARGARVNVASVAALILAVQGAQMGHLSMRGFLALLVTVWDAVEQQEASAATDGDSGGDAEVQS